MDQPITLDVVLEFLRSTPFFDGLDAFERAEVARIMEVQRLQAGETVFREGEDGESWYIVFEGSARVVKKEAGGTSVVARCGPGGCFGEMAILDGMPRSAGVEAEGPLTLFRFRRARFDGLLEQGSLGAYKLVASMARLLSRRHRDLAVQIGELQSGGRALDGAIETHDMSH